MRLVLFWMRLISPCRLNLNSQRIQHRTLGYVKRRSFDWLWRRPQFSDRQYRGVRHLSRQLPKSHLAKYHL
ncbi:uncharacterized protein BDW43DRAFT_278618 [Aspergillus alliaceus]|uniref:uncharacterized protein n=1 Tax=Petromyces alliaceus TaxID=209559 RepID=UPI0012A77789|nr:uncharacterized protein BDW43DRAFT_278618 [Aspergillus alliaceus]KAB8232790.1 hypothetical protein BDW43DRAFT_278618 [Aspergillus alliaceus]